MKNYLKILPVVAGLALAIIGTPTTAKESKNTEAAAYGFCQGDENRLCGTTLQGTKVYGRWKEGPGSGQPIKL